MVLACREIAFCYGHRLLDYEFKCRHLHGHNGRALMTLRAEGLTPAEIDRMHRAVADWVDRNMDHVMLLHRDDPVLPTLKSMGEPVFVMERNPTAENIARAIFDFAASQGFPVIEVGLWESDKNFATYRGSGQWPVVSGQ